MNYYELLIAQMYHFLGIPKLEHSRVYKNRKKNVHRFFTNRKCVKNVLKKTCPCSTKTRCETNHP